MCSSDLGPAGEGRDILVEGPKFVLERWAAGDHAVALPEGRTAWLIPITGSGSVAGVDFTAGQCLTVTGAETVHLSAEECLSLQPSRGSKRLDADTERSHGTQYRDAAISRLFGEPRRLGIDLLGLLGKAVTGELDGIRSKGVRLDDLGTRAYVRLVDLTHQGRMSEVELIVADRKSTRLNSSHMSESRMPSSA